MKKIKLSHIEILNNNNNNNKSFRGKSISKFLL